MEKVYQSHPVSFGVLSEALSVTHSDLTVVSSDKFPYHETLDLIPNDDSELDTIDPFASVFIEMEDTSPELPEYSYSPERQDSPTQKNRKCINLLIKNGRVLRDVLTTYDKGKLILKVYQQQQFLDKANAILLCDLVIQHEFQGNPHTRLQGPQLCSLAKSIVELFPNESVESYYSPCRSFKGKIIKRPRGRLLDKYEHRLKSFRAAGLIKSRVKRKTKPPEIENN